MANEQINEWIGTEDAAQILNEYYDSYKNTTIFLTPQSQRTLYLIAYAYKCGRMDARVNKRRESWKTNQVLRNK